MAFARAATLRPPPKLVPKGGDQIEQVEGKKCLLFPLNLDYSKNLKCKEERERERKRSR